MDGKENMKLTVGKLRELIADMPDDALVMYPVHHKVCCLKCYSVEHMWKYPKEGKPKDALVLTPGDNYDP
jgi:hypothetical protein